MKKVLVILLAGFAIVGCSKNEATPEATASAVQAPAPVAAPVASAPVASATVAAPAASAPVAASAAK